MRALLTNYLADADAPADINHLRIGPIASCRVWFDEWAGVKASSLCDGVVERLRPDVYRQMARESEETLYMKVHDAWGLTDRGEPLFPADVTGGVIHVLRNPLDLAASYAHHSGVALEKAVEFLCDPAHAMARSHRGLADQLHQKMFDWSRHARSWADDSGLRVHQVRYEDLSRDPEAVFGRIVRFCGLPCTDAQVAKAVAFSRFDELQRQEQQHGFREGSVAASGPFFRRGRVGGWREELPAELARRLIEAHGDTMRRFGYDGDGSLD